MAETKLEQDLSRNSYLDLNVKEYFLDELRSKYNRRAINKKELAYELTLTPKTISQRISLGTFPIKYIKNGKAKQSSVFFLINDVANYLAKEIYFTSQFIQ